MIKRGAGRHRTVLHGGKIAFLAIGLLLAGCSTAAHTQADAQPKLSDSQDAQLIEQSKTAMAACDAQFPAGDPKIAVARRKCVNGGFSIRLPTFGPDQDLVRAFLADSLVIAQKIQDGQMTIAEGNAAMAQRWTQAVAESQKRANTKDSVLAQQSAAAAHQPVTAVESTEVTPVELPNFTCVQKGNMATCN
jgi:hypothetical protein